MAIVMAKVGGSGPEAEAADTYGRLWMPMTMQRMDSFSYLGERAEAIAISRRFSFSPANNFGIAAASWATSNYRGFWCNYSVDESLVINNLYLFSKDHLYPPINGKDAEEIPEFRHILDDINKKARIPKQYRDSFPMQYIGIDYEYEYSGRIVLGLNPKRNKSGLERYRKVIELVFENGMVLEATDITEHWRSSEERQGEATASYWWEQKDNDYFYLINFSFMGIDET